jgi:hypothetical protein
LEREILPDGANDNEFSERRIVIETSRSSLKQTQTVHFHRL